MARPFIFQGLERTSATVAVSADIYLLGIQWKQ
jgi:hypothetical protein